MEIACNSSGTHTIQSLCEIKTSIEEELLLLKCVEKHLLKLSCNSNGTHIIQKIVTCCEEENRDFVNKFITENVSKLSMNANGICVVKKFMNATKMSDSKFNLLKFLEEDCIEIVEDAFGNYAIQYALDVYGLEICSNLIDVILKNLVQLCNQKFSSNVVEKVIQSSNKVRNNLFFRICLLEL